MEAFEQEHSMIAQDKAFTESQIGDARAGEKGDEAEAADGEAEPLPQRESRKRHRIRWQTLYYETHRNVRQMVLVPCILVGACAVLLVAATVSVDAPGRLHKGVLENAPALLLVLLMRSRCVCGRGRAGVLLGQTVLLLPPSPGGAATVRLCTPASAACPGHAPPRPPARPLDVLRASNGRRVVSFLATTLLALVALGLGAWWPCEGTACSEWAILRSSSARVLWAGLAIVVLRYSACCCAADPCNHAHKHLPLAPRTCSLPGCLACSGARVLVCAFFPQTRCG